MDEEILKKYITAGKIAAKVRSFACSLVKENVKIIDIANAVDKKIEELGAKPAFPVNISINDIAAHYTPTTRDEIPINQEDYVKIDVGIHVDGFIADTAATIRPAGRDELIACAEEMLEEALKMFTPGMRIGDIGAAVEDVAKRHGFNPIANLSGHGLAQYNLHAGVMIPNIKSNNNYRLKDGEVYAVEPFCTKGSGFVKDVEPAVIFRWLKDVPSRLAEGKKIMELAKTKYAKLPFARRWIEHNVGQGIVIDMALKQLIAAGGLHPYLILKESSGSAVAQAEHTVIVADQPIVTTR